MTISYSIFHGQACEHKKFYNINSHFDPSTGSASNPTAASLLRGALLTLKRSRVIHLITIVTRRAVLNYSSTRFTGLVRHPVRRATHAYCRKNLLLACLLWRKPTCWSSYIISIVCNLFRKKGLFEVFCLNSFKKVCVLFQMNG